MTLPLREIEGKYEILHKIKEGGMGAIYKVRHRLLEEMRVIKVIRPQLASNQELQQRFRREAKTAIRLKHPNVAQIYDFALDEHGAAYIVMELIDGVTVGELLAKGGPPGLALGLEMARQSLLALAYLHHQGYLHRDIATDNVMLARRYDGTALVKLIDLGIAKRLGVEGELTQTGAFLGKVRYASPEQFGDGKVKLDHRSDLYSFGVVLYELLTGRYPISGEGFSEIIAGHLFRPPMGFAESDPEGRIPEGVRQALLQALAKDPGERFASAEEMAAALAPFARPPEELRYELDRALAATSAILPRPEPAEPGSTQSRLDAQFGLATTPPPTSPGPRPVTGGGPGGSAEGEDHRRQVAALLENARLMTRLEQMEKAQHELRRLLALEPEHAEARELLDTVRGARRQRREAPRRLDAAREALEAGNLEEARRRLEEAREVAAGEPALRELEAAIQKAQDQEAKRARLVERAAQRAGKLLDQAGLDEAKLQRAEEALEKAEERYGRDEEALVALRFRLAEARREAAGHQAEEHLATARRHCDAGDFDAALGAVVQALTLDASQRQARALEAEIARRRQSGEWRRPAAREQRAKEPAERPAEQPASQDADPRLDELLAHARRLFEGGAHDLARLRLRELLEQAPGHGEAQELLARVEAASEDREASGGTAVTEAVRSIGREIEAGRLELAARELDFALDRYGEDPRLLALRQRIAEAARPAPAPEASGEPPPVSAAVDTGPLAPGEESKARRRALRSPWLWAAALLLAVLAVALLGGLLGSRQAGPAVAPALEEEAGGPGAATVAESGETAAAAPGHLVVDARPGGRLEEILGPDGELVPLPADPLTPLRLTLPPGRYTLTLSPDPGGESRQVEAEVLPGEIGEVVVDFNPATADRGGSP